MFESAKGATTLSRTTCSIMTLGTTTLCTIIKQATLSINDTQLYNNKFLECNTVIISNFVMLSVIMLNSVMLSVITLNSVTLNSVMLSVIKLNSVMLSVIMLNSVMLSVLMLNVVMLSVTRLSVVAACLTFAPKSNFCG